MKVNEYGCPFCNEFNGKKHLSYFENTIGKKYGINKRCILETKNFVSIPSIGSFVEGYLLIVPRKHFLSFLSMPFHYTEELNSIITCLSDFYLDCYHSKFVIFEHGSSSLDNTGGMSVLHAHLHIVPYNSLFISDVKDYHFIKYNKFLVVKRNYFFRNKQNPYLFFRDIDGVYYYCENENIPSQFFRKRLCNLLGFINMGDWKEYPFIKNIEKTIVSADSYQLQTKYNKKTGGKYG